MFESHIIHAVRREVEIRGVRADNQLGDRLVADLHMMKGTEDHYIEVSVTNPCNGSDITSTEGGRRGDRC